MIEPCDIVSDRAEQSKERKTRGQNHASHGLAWLRRAWL